MLRPLLIIAWFTTALGCQGEPAQHAAVECNQPVWRLGEVSAATYSHEFVLRNNTDKAVALHSIQTTCGCLHTGETPESIPARGEIRIPIKISVPHLPGSFTKRLIALVGETGEDAVQMAISGTVPANGMAYVTPRALNFGALDQHETAERILVVGTYDGSPVTKLRVTGLPMQIELLRKEVMPDRKIRLTFSVAGKRLPAPIKDSVKLHCCSMDAPILVPVEATVANATPSLVSSIYITDLNVDAVTKFRLAKDESQCIEKITFRGTTGMTVRLLADSESEPNLIGFEIASGMDDQRLFTGELDVWHSGATTHVTIPVTVVARGDVY